MTDRIDALTQRVDVISYRTKSHEIKINHMLNPHGYVPFNPDDFVWVNQDGATIYENEVQKFEPLSHYFRAEAKGGGDKVRMLVKDIPAGPHKAELVYKPNSSRDQFTGCGMILRNKTSGRLITFGTLYHGGGNLEWVGMMHSPTSFAGERYRVNYDLPCYSIRYEATETHRLFYATHDGHNFELMCRIPKDDFFVEDQIGVFTLTNTGNVNGFAAMSILHWKDDIQVI